MLSDHERRVLTAIEHDLHIEDPDLAEAFRDGRCPPERRRRHWPSLLTMAMGVLILLVGIVAGAGALVMEGLLVTGAGYVYRRWHARHWADRPRAGGRRALGRRGPGRRAPGGGSNPDFRPPPQQWHRPA